MTKKYSVRGKVGLRPRLREYKKHKCPIVEDKAAKNTRPEWAEGWENWENVAMSNPGEIFKEEAVSTD